MMKLALPVKAALCAVVCFAIIHTPVSAKTMYRWVDEHGKVSFSDQVPPDQAALGHQELDKNANVVKVSGKAKTKAEFEIAKRLEKLRKQQEQIVIKQKAHDQKLLSSYINVTALDTTREAKTQALADQNREIRETIKKLADELSAKHREAAVFEIKNTKVPKGLLDQIEENQKKTAKANQDLNELQLKKAATEKEFAVDKARYLFLTQSKKNPSTADKATAPVIQSGLYECDNVAQCEKVWVIAKDFVKNNSKAKISIDSETLLMSEDPVSDTDFSLSVSKMLAEGKKTQIFLDVRCTNTIAGNTVCSSPKAEDIRGRFNDDIKAKLNAAPAATPASKTSAAATTSKSAPGAK